MNDVIQKTYHFLPHSYCESLTETAARNMRNYRLNIPINNEFNDLFSNFSGGNIHIFNEDYYITVLWADIL